LRSLQFVDDGDLVAARSARMRRWLTGLNQLAQFSPA
jgi:hypothetical protein